MKFILLFVFLFVGCGQDGVAIRDLDGVDGKDGLSLVSESTYSEDICAGNSGNTTVIAQDVNANGVLDEEDTLQSQFITCYGEQGERGVAGINCSVNRTGNNSIVTCGETSVTIADGLDGEDGLDGTLIEVVEFCNNNNNWREIGIKVGDKVIALFQQTSSVNVTTPNGQTSVINGMNNRLVVLVNGSYVTTDGNNCHFSVNNGQVIRGAQ